VQLTVYSLILITVILWRPSGLLGVFTDAYERVVHAGQAHARETTLDG
jgi:branched-chain amino acid transport system permease protein